MYTKDLVLINQETKEASRSELSPASLYSFRVVTPNAAAFILPLTAIENRFLAAVQMQKRWRYVIHDNYGDAANRP